MTAKELAKKRAKQYEALLVLLRGTMAVKGVSVDDLCGYAGLGRTMLYDRLKHPWDFSLGELRGVAARLGISDDELRAKAF